MSENRGEASLGKSRGILSQMDDKRGLYYTSSHMMAGSFGISYFQNLDSLKFGKSDVDFLIIINFKT